MGKARAHVSRDRHAHLFALCGCAVLLQEAAKKQRKGKTMGYQPCSSYVAAAPARGGRSPTTDLHDCRDCRLCPLAAPSPPPTTSCKEREQSGSFFTPVFFFSLAVSFENASTNGFSCPRGLDRSDGARWRAAGRSRRILAAEEVQHPAGR